MPTPTHPCQICEPTACVDLGSKHSAFHGRDYSYLRCPDCGHIHVYPFPGYDVYDDAYYRGEGPDPFVDYEREFSDYRTMDRMLEFEDLFRIVEARLRAHPAQGPVRWIDYGCGAGGFLKFLRDRGSIAGRPLALFGCDIGSYASRLEREDGFRILNPLAIDPAANGSFEIVTCVEVAEHVRETRALFRTLADLLRPGGFLLLTTGNLESFAARRAGLNYRYMMPEVHISLFNPRALVRLYRENSLSPVRVHYRGVVRFKVVKSLRRPRLKALARVALRLPGVTRLIDMFYGVSAMPCAEKPALVTGTAPSSGAGGSR